MWTEFQCFRFLKQNLALRSRSCPFGHVTQCHVHFNYPTTESIGKLRNQQFSKGGESNQDNSQRTIFSFSIPFLSLKLAPRLTPQEAGSVLDLTRWTQSPPAGSPLKVSKILFFVSFYFSTLTHCFVNTSHSRRFKTSWINNLPLYRPDPLTIWIPSWI